MTTFNVGILIGSLSSESINRKLSTALTALAPSADLELTEIPIRDLPVYNRDLDYTLPTEVQTFKAALANVDAVIIATPEYNRSIPGALKNALDWVSRPYGDNSLAGKPSAVIGASRGQIGTAVAQQHLRSILSFLASPELAQPEAYIWDKPDLIADTGEITDDSTRDFLRNWLKAVHTHIAKTLTPVE